MNGTEIKEDTSMNYSDKHIDALIERLGVYEDRLDGKLEPGEVTGCKVCVSKCDNCLITHCIDEGSNGRCWLTGWTGFSRKHALKWYREMIRQANKNLKAANSEWRLVGGY